MFCTIGSGTDQGAKRTCPFYKKIPGNLQAMMQENWYMYSGFPTGFDTSQPLQSQKIARSLK